MNALLESIARSPKPGAAKRVPGGSRPLGSWAQRYGASHLVFIIGPLICAFFINLVNAVAIPFFLARYQG